MIRSLFLLVLTLGSASAAPDWKAVEPILAGHCYECHNGEKAKGDVDLKKFAADPQLAAEFELWGKVRDSIAAGDMPPKKGKPLGAGQQDQVTQWVQQGLDALAAANAGDPGPVTMRRLTNAEYDNTIRDLTWRDYGLAAEFQTDGGGGEGFTNTGDVLFLSPASIDKYFSAARKLAEHATVMPGTGIVFHPQRIGLRGPVQVKTQAEQGLYVWLQQKAALHLPKDMEDLRQGDYMLAAWKHKHVKTPIPVLAQKAKLNAVFLQNWWNLLNSTEPKSRFLDLTRVPWRALPGPDPAKPNEVPVVVQSTVQRLRDELASWNDAKRPGSGVQAFGPIR
jgi:hypothetical protein